LLSVQASLAQSPAPEQASPVTDPSPFRVEVVLVGIVGHSAALTQGIGDLLRARGINLRFSRQDQLTEQDLLGQQRARDPGRATIWITLPRPDLARLVLADPEFQRFLVREIPLPHGIDELGRESIGQVVESSSLALLQGATGMSRSEVRLALGEEFKPAANPPGQPSPSPAEPPPRDRPGRALRLRLGATYGLGWSGSAFGLLHGPGILSGLEFVGPRDSLTLTAAFEWHLGQHYRTSEIELEVQSNAGWLLLGWRKPVREPTSLLAALGPGLDLTRVVPRAVPGGAADAVPSYLHPTPWVRAELGFEWGDSPLVLQLLAVTDVSITRTHYDIDRGGSAARVATPWFIRPGVTAAGVWR
jgi:hypothetical protein